MCSFKTEFGIFCFDLLSFLRKQLKQESHRKQVDNQFPASEERIWQRDKEINEKTRTHITYYYNNIDNKNQNNKKLTWNLAHGSFFGIAVFFFVKSVFVTCVGTSSARAEEKKNARYEEKKYGQKKIYKWWCDVMQLKCDMINVVTTDISLATLLCFFCVCCLYGDSLLRFTCILWIKHVLLSIANFRCSNLVISHRSCCCLNADAIIRRLFLFLFHSLSLACSRHLETSFFFASNYGIYIIID